MSLNLVVSLFGEEGALRRPLWVPNVKQPVAAVRRVIEAMFNEDHHKKGRNRSKNCCNTVRLFFNGNELEDGFLMEQYDLAEGNVIQVQKIVKKSENLSTELPPLFNDHQQRQKQQITTKNQQFLTSDLYYCLGEHIDALDDDTGAWFPATIAAIIKDDDNDNNNNNSGHTYIVTFRKPSLGGRIPRCLSQIRPPSSKLFNSFDDLSPGQAVLVLVESVRNWQVGLIEQTIRDLRYSKKKSAGKVVISLVMGINSNENGGTVLQQYVHQFKIGTLLELQSNVHKTQRSPELETVLKNGLPSGSRFYEPDCSACSDDPSVERCTFCGCSVCSLKSRPEAQLLCDECDRPTHLECLAEPLFEVPNDVAEDWYCDQCRTESAEKVRQKQRDHLKSKKGGDEVVRGNWGFGMSAAKRSSPAPRLQFGAIEGVPVGAWWRFRVQASAAGVHRPLVAGVDGNLKDGGGVYSIVFSGANAEDVDLGEELYFSPTREQQSRALALNCSKGEGRPVRVLRSGNGRSGQRARSLYLPKVGVRYDGLYRVVRFWREEDSGQWRFYLKRDDPAPAPWTEAGRYQARKTGFLVPRYPDGWTTEMAGKRRLTVDLKMVERAEKRVKKEITLDKNKQKFTVAWSIPAAVEALIEQDTLPISRQKQWAELRQLARESGKEAFFARLAETFTCIVCLEPLTIVLEHSLVTLPTCGHVLCGRCLQRTIEEAEMDSCPVCRSKPLVDTPKENRLLEKVLRLLLAD